MPYPEDHDFFELCCSNQELGSIGAGYPLLFEFMKAIGFQMLILTIIYFLPVAYMIYQILGDYLSQEASGNPIALASFGAFLVKND